MTEPPTKRRKLDGKNSQQEPRVAILDYLTNPRPGVSRIVVDSNGRRLFLVSFIILVKNGAVTSIDLGSASQLKSSVLELLRNTVNRQYASSRVSYYRRHGGGSRRGALFSALQSCSVSELQAFFAAFVPSSALLSSSSPFRIDKNVLVHDLCEWYESKTLLSDRRGEECLVLKNYDLNQMFFTFCVLRESTRERIQYRIPKEIMESILCYRGYDSESLAELGPVSNDFFALVLSTWGSEVRVTSSNLMKIPVLVIRSLKELRVVSRSHDGFIQRTQLEDLLQNVSLTRLEKLCIETNSVAALKQILTLLMEKDLSGFVGLRAVEFDLDFDEYGYADERTLEFVGFELSRFGPNLVEVKNCPSVRMVEGLKRLRRLSLSSISRIIDVDLLHSVSVLSREINLEHLSLFGWQQRFRQFRRDSRLGIEGKGCLQELWKSTRAIPSWELHNRDLDSFLVVPVKPWEVKVLVLHYSVHQKDESLISRFPTCVFPLLTTLSIQLYPRASPDGIIEWLLRLPSLLHLEICIHRIAGPLQMPAIPRLVRLIDGYQRLRSLTVGEAPIRARNPLDRSSIRIYDGGRFIEVRRNVELLVAAVSPTSGLLPICQRILLSDLNVTKCRPALLQWMQTLRSPCPFQERTESSCLCLVRRN